MAGYLAGMNRAGVNPPAMLGTGAPQTQTTPGATNVFGNAVGGQQYNRDATQGPVNLANMYSPFFATNPFKKTGKNFLNPPPVPGAGTQPITTQMTQAGTYGQAGNGSLYVPSNTGAETSTPKG